MYTIEEEPNMDWTKVLGIGLIYLGFLMFLVVLHIVTINETGDTQTVLNGVFSVMVTIFGGAVLFGGGITVIHLLRWLTWCINMPAWKKEKIRKRRRGGY